MKAITTILFALSLSFCFSQKEKGWYPVLDSLGANLYDSTGKYLVITYSPFNESMKKEIDTWLMATNASLKDTAGVLISEAKNRKAIAYKNSPKGEWIKAKK